MKECTKERDIFTHEGWAFTTKQIKTLPEEAVWDRVDRAKNFTPLSLYPGHCQKTRRITTLHLIVAFLWLEMNILKKEWGYSQEWRILIKWWILIKFEHLFILNNTRAFLFLSGIVFYLHSAWSCFSPLAWAIMVIMRRTTAAAVLCMLMAVCRGERGLQSVGKDEEKKPRFGYDRNI